MFEHRRSDNSPCLGCPPSCESPLRRQYGCCALSLMPHGQQDSDYRCCVGFSHDPAMCSCGTAHGDGLNAPCSSTCTAHGLGFHPTIDTKAWEIEVPVLLASIEPGERTLLNAIEAARVMLEINGRAARDATPAVPERRVEGPTGTTILPAEPARPAVTAVVGRSSKVRAALLAALPAFVHDSDSGRTAPLGATLLTHGVGLRNKKDGHGNVATDKDGAPILTGEGVVRAIILEKRAGHDPAHSEFHHRAPTAAERTAIAAAVQAA